MNKKFFAGVALAVLSTGSAMAAGTLAGPYVGVQLGFAKPTMTVEDSDCWYDCSAYTNTKFGLGAGIQGGWNWVSGNFLAGVSAEYTFASIKKDSDYSLRTNGTHDEEINAKYKGVASLRGRVGLVVNDTAIVVSAGPAIGRFESELRDLNNDGVANANDDVARNSGSISGLVTGVSIEHALTERMSLGLEVSSYSFKNENEHFVTANGAVQTSQTNHVYSLQTANLSLNWRF